MLKSIGDMTRGMRNKNPFNIRKSSTNWFGKVPGTDKEFETFDTIYHGYRAGIVLLKTYYNKYRLHTIAGVIKRFAPSSENDTEAYIKYISSRTTLDPHARLSERQLLEHVAPYIAEYESHCILPKSFCSQIIYNVNKEYE